MKQSKEIIKLILDDVLSFHHEMETSHDYKMAPGLRDQGSLESAINAPFQSFADEDCYPALSDKAARLCYGLVKNHPFVDGNKRLAIHSMLVFLAINEFEVDYEDDEMEEIIINVANGKMHYEELSEWLKERI